MLTSAVSAANIAQLNLLWGRLILDELARLGVKHVCMAPGSRSTPLTLAAAEQTKLKQHVHFDERGLAFYAMGLAKASQAPVAIITTSGTAVANLYPAIIEAWLTKVPLIVLSGDRPPELLDCGANQAIVQPAIFANYAKQLNLPTPDFNIAPNALLSSIDDAVANTSTPIHINCMYREPLYPEGQADEALFSEYLQPIAQWQQQQTPWCHIAQVSQQNYPLLEPCQRFAQAKGVIIAGTLRPEENPQALLALAERLGWPILTDAQCQLRQHPSVIGHIDQLLHHADVQTLLAQAHHVLVVGGRLLSKRLIRYLATQSWQQYWQLLPQQERLDPSHNRKQLFVGTIDGFCQLFTAIPAALSPWASPLLAANKKLEQLFISEIDQGEFGEAQVVRHLTQLGEATHTQQNTQQLFIGNSLPVRLFDMYAPVHHHQQTHQHLQGSAIVCAHTTFTNRGASGIDGLLATACGIAADKQLPTTLIIGDLSQLHDLNSLALAHQLCSPLVILILNNDGGNIFNLLPVPTEQLRSNYYRLSHGFTFEGAATMFKLPYTQVDQYDAFCQAYTNACQHQGASVIEVMISQDQASNQIAAISKQIKSLAL